MITLQRFGSFNYVIEVFLTTFMRVRHKTGHDTPKTSRDLRNPKKQRKIKLFAASALRILQRFRSFNYAIKVALHVRVLTL